ncbi:MAG: chemotaxis protein CheC, partial [Ruminiclostridium sp.]|nr:chemotaxis protein CheC [Ruminiclostridium sp.]
MENIEFSEIQKDAIGEILNISMGSAATAVSELL